MTSPLGTAPLLPRQDPGPSAPDAHDAGLLLLRVLLGVVMAAHGTQKLFGWFDGGGLEGTEMFFESVGYPAAGAMALLTALIETFGGLALIVGLLTPLAAAAAFGTMLNAISVKWGGGFFLPDGMEYEITLAVLAVGIALAGPGRIAIDRSVPVLRDHRLSHGLAATALGAVVAGIVLLIRN